MHCDKGSTKLNKLLRGRRGIWIRFAMERCTCRSGETLPGWSTCGGTRNDNKGAVQ